MDRGATVNDSPYTFGEARQALHAASQRQIDGERALREAVEDLAQSELAYNRACARKMIDLHGEGVAWTAARSLATGDSAVSELRYQRDVKRGVVDAAERAGYRLQADRRGLEKLIGWSERREIAEGGA
jgi:hypothetical protein